MDSRWSALSSWATNALLLFTSLLVLHMISFASLWYTTRHFRNSNAKISDPPSVAPTTAYEDKETLLGIDSKLPRAPPINKRHMFESPSDGTRFKPHHGPGNDLSPVSIWRKANDVVPL